MEKVVVAVGGGGEVERWESRSLGNGEGMRENR